MSNTLSLVIGIASSLIATALFIGASEVCRRVLLPWFADKIYRGVRIDGTWEHKNSFEGEKILICLELSQKSDKITGTYFHQLNEGNPEHYLLSGVLRDSYLTAMIHPLSPHQLDAGCFLLHVHSADGMKMEGIVLSVSSKTGSVKSHPNASFGRKYA
jgi:hypothetical protein